MMEIDYLLSAQFVSCFLEESIPKLASALGSGKARIHSGKESNALAKFCPGSGTKIVRGTSVIIMGVVFALEQLVIVTVFK